MHGNSKYTAELAQEIVERLSKGEPLAVICRDISISHDAVDDWQRKNDDFKRSIARAREVGFDAIANSARDITRGRGDSTGDVQRDKLIVETDLKLLAKWDPKRYGDKTQVEIGSDPAKPIITSNMTPEEAYKLIAGGK